MIGSTGINFLNIGVDINHLSLDEVFGAVFSLFAYVMGVPIQDIGTVGSLLGTKMVINEFVAYANMSPMIAQQTLSPKAIMIASFAWICEFFIYCHTSWRHW